MKFDELYNELMNESMEENDPLFKQALEILKVIKAKSPNAYDKLMDRLNALGSMPSKATKTYNLPEDPDDASWVVSMEK